VIKPFLKLFLTYTVLTFIWKVLRKLLPATLATGTIRYWQMMRESQNSSSGLCLDKVPWDCVSLTLDVRRKSPWGSQGRASFYSTKWQLEK